MDAVIFDMDGTLCDVEPIRHYVTGERRNFDAFHKASLWCGPNVSVRFFARTLARGNETAVIIVTARDARYERETRDWLAKYGITYDALYMRPWGDGRRDSVVKAGILDQIRRDGFNPVLAVDDRDDIIAVWEEGGIETIKVGV